MSTLVIDVVIRSHMIMLPPAGRLWMQSLTWSTVLTLETTILCHGESPDEKLLCVYVGNDVSLSSWLLDPLFNLPEESMWCMEFY